MAEVATHHYTTNNATAKHLASSPESSDVVDDGRTGLNLDLLKTSYDARLNTYTNRWRVDFLSPQLLAIAGFYYTGYSDIVCCPYCNVEVGKWEVGDVPLNDHIKWSPNCRFHRDMLPQADQSSGSASTSSGIASNVSETSESSSSSSIAAGQDTCGKFGIVHSRTSNPENSSVVAGSSIVSSGVPGIHEAKASYKHYAMIDRRLETFAEWPVSITQKPRDLAEAGFFYTGKSDQTVCFYCGGGLKDWESNDQPWQQHAKWFPKCNFVLLHKGVEYTVEQQQKGKEQQAAAAAALAGEVAPQASAAAEVKPAEQMVSTPDNLLCKICFSKEMGVVFLPCGHMVACVDCAPVLTKCAVCRKAVDAYVRAFLS